MRRPVCAYCRVEMRCVKNEHIVEVADEGEPYQLWSGDKYTCPSCHATVVIGFSLSPVAERGDAHYEPTAHRAAECGHFTRLK